MEGYSRLSTLLSNIKTYKDIMNLTLISSRTVPKLVADENIKAILNQFRSEYPEFKDYADRLLVGVMYKYKSVEAMKANIPMCKYCHKKHVLVDSVWFHNMSRDVQFKDFCSDCRKQSQSEVAYNNQHSRSAEECEAFKQKMHEVWANRSDDELHTIKQHMSEFRANETDEQKRLRNLRQKATVDSKTQEERDASVAKAKRSKAIKKYQLFAESEILPMFTEEEFIENFDNQFSNEFTWKCKKCGKEFTSPVDPWFYEIYKVGHARCPSCYSIPAVYSFEEKEMVDYIKSIYTGEIIENDKSIISPLEIDIYLPEKSLAIEYDGMLWHSENFEYNGMVKGKDSDYHLSKTVRCKQAGVRLLHIFGSDWKNEKDKIQNFIKDVIGVDQRVIDVSTCTMRLISKHDATEFYKTYDIQSSECGTVNYGIFLNDELVVVLSFVSLENLKNMWLMMYCNKFGTSLTGNMSMLTDMFIKSYNPKSIVGLADRRFYDGKIYEDMGFAYDGVSDPDYMYWKSHGFAYETILSTTCKTPGFLEQLPVYDPNLSEVENMFANKYYRIFDCGVIFYRKQLRK